MTAGRLLAAFIVVSSAGVASATQPLFDAHLHYNSKDAARYTPDQIVEILKEANIERALVTSRPPAQVLSLYRHAPTMVVPLLGVYRSFADKGTWMHDATLPARVAEMLANGPWRGIGELHIFAMDRRSPVFREIVALAVQHDLPLQMHCDPSVIDALFEYAPSARVIWAHGGAYPYPSILRDYLERYPGLAIDLSVRDHRIAPDGVLDTDWEWLLMEYPDRFMVGVDTYRTARWSTYAEAAGEIRAWLEQLPESVSQAIAYGNAARRFGQPGGD